MLALLMRGPISLDVLGRSIHDKLVVDCLKVHKIALPKNEEDLDEFGGEATLGDDKSGIFIELMSREHYDREFDRPSKAKTKNDDEWMVSSFDLLGAKSNTSRTRKYPHPLPFDLAFGASADDVIAKLGSKPFEKIAGGKNNYHQGWWFLVDGLKILVALSEDKRLKWMRIKPLDKETAAARRRKASLAKQNANIDPKNVGAVTAAARRRPTAAWKERMKEGDSSFTAPGIAAADKLIDRFIENITKATKTKSARGVYSATKSVVLGFNALNSHHGDLVETMEREELCAFIESLVKASGYRLAKNEDITAEWRGW